MDLPAPLRQFYAPHRAFVVEHSIDPDMWRTVGLRGEAGPEDPNHFLDIDDLGRTRAVDRRAARLEGVSGALRRRLA